MQSGWSVLGRPPIVVPFVILAFAGCATPLPSLDADSASLAAEDAWQRVFVFDGERGPIEPPTVFSFEVPTGAQEVEALLTWTAAGATLTFILVDPSGETVAQGWGEAPGRAYVTTTHPVVPGEWTIEITSERSVAAAFAATVTVRSQALPEGPLNASFALPPRSPARALPPELRAPLAPLGPRDYAEVNLNMAPEDFFTFAWTSTSDVYFNVHFHGADGTERPIEQRGSELAGEFSANMTEVYALLWRNEGNTSVQIDAQIDGRYRLHSMTRSG